MKDKYHQLVDKFISTGELGHYNLDNKSIMLYDIENQEKVLSRIKNDISLITRNFKFIVLNPSQPITNINILDIEL